MITLFPSFFCFLLLVYELQVKTNEGEKNKKKSLSYEAGDICLTGLFLSILDSDSCVKG